MQTFPMLCMLAMWLAPNAAQAAPAAPTATPPACSASASALPEATTTFTVGTLRVERYGDHGRPVILIPGLGSGSWVWARTIEHLRDDHVVYALTLAGFDGLPPPEQMTGLLDQADAALLKLIRSRHIDHPVLVGHSMGGTLAIRFAGEHSDLVSGVLAVDALPVFPMTENLTSEQRQARAASVHTFLGAMTPEQFKAQQGQYMKTMGLIDPEQAACYAKLQVRSDQAAVAAYMGEDMGLDYRPLMKAIDVPLVVISPYYAPDFKALAARTGKPVISAQGKADYYASLLANDPQARVVTIKPARHFVMLDQPDKFLDALDRFLSRLPAVTGHD